MIDDLVTWLRAQLDDDERVAPNVHALDCELTLTAGFNGPCTCGWPDRMAAEVDARRRIIDRYAELRSDVLDALNRDEPDEAPTATEFVYEQVCQFLALPYADRPGYRTEWRP